MPEGPEVAVIREGLLKIKYEIIIDVLVTDHQKYTHILQHIEFLKHSTITAIDRYGKFLLFTFTKHKQQIYALNHLGMTGIWRILPRTALVFSKQTIKQQFKHYKVAFLMQNHIVLFNDTRIFGKFEIYTNLQTVLKNKGIRNLGPDILDANFDVQEFITRMRGKRNTRTQAIGKSLLNSHIVAGCGNIYKSESLFCAKILPTHSVASLTDNDLKKLAKCLMQVGQTAFANRGSTLKDYSTTEGYSGLMQNKFNVYGRENKPCYNCQTLIQKIMQGDRSSFFCPKCQV